jgi:hypothetical protein
MPSESPDLNSDFVVSIDQEVSEVKLRRPHVVILGAGASRAACPSGDKNGQPLPLMQDLVDVVGLRPLLEKSAVDPDRNFEEIFSDLQESGNVDRIAEIQEAIESYFRRLRLPDEPTLYDHLVLSLREGDLIASFNWDPLLLHAYWRNAKSGLSQPRWAFLHGNVALGQCAKDKISGLAHNACPRCGELYETVPLLYPIKKKDYACDPYIAEEWRVLRWGLKGAFMMTIFGYSAPRTDQEAIAAMKEAWGDKSKRFMEQTAFITTQSDDDIRENWTAFIHTHHYELHNGFYSSWIAKHPRRTGEAYWNQYVDAKFIEDNPIPRDLGFPELWNWYDKFKNPEERAQIGPGGDK